MAQETDEVFLTLITISHDSLTGPMYIVDHYDSIISNGVTYAGFPFQITLPDSGGEKPPRAQIKIDNIDRSIISTLRGLLTPPMLQIDVVLASQPDVVEMSFGHLTLENIQYDSMEITGELAYENILVEPYPGISYTPDLFPGMK